MDDSPRSSSRNDLSSHEAVMLDYWDDLPIYGWEVSFRRKAGMALEVFINLSTHFPESWRMDNAIRYPTNSHDNPLTLILPAP